jgi:putative ABC transport system permease protein
VKINGNEITSQQIYVDQYFLSVAGIQIRKDRTFSREFTSDSANSTIVNEAFVRQARLKELISQQVIFVDGEGINHPKTIVGVVRDFHYGSFKEKIDPVALVLHPSEFIWIKLRKPYIAKGLSRLGDNLRKAFPQFDYQYSFVDDTIRDQYKNDQRWKQVISYASALAIMICCIGLVGLVNFETLRRRKEIAVRKVLGSSVINISLLLSWDFLRLVSLAIIIASPIAWYTMNRWLHNFIYRTNISWLDFAISAFFVLLIALATVNIRAIGAAIASPLKSLRTE